MLKKFLVGFMVALSCIIGSQFVEVSNAEAADYYVCADENGNEVWIIGKSVKRGNNKWECSFKRMSPSTHQIVIKSYIKFFKEGPVMYYKPVDGPSEALTPDSRHKVYVKMLEYIWAHKDMH